MVPNMIIELDSKEEQVEISVEPDEILRNTLADLVSYWDLKGNHIFESMGERLDLESRWAQVEGGRVINLKKASLDKTLPDKTWRRRIANELDLLDDVETEVREEQDSYSIKVLLEGIPGPVKVGKTVGKTFKHRFTIELGRDYPYRPPNILWRTPIFHPNISPSEKGGKVSCDYLNNWRFSYSLKGLVSAISKLLRNPEGSNRREEKTCVEAYFTLKERGLFR